MCAAFVCVYIREKGKKQGYVATCKGASLDFLRGVSVYIENNENIHGDLEECLKTSKCQRGFPQRIHISLNLSLSSTC